MRGYTLIELLLVLALMGLLLTMTMPRLSAFLGNPEERELRELEHFMLRAGRRAVREPLVPENQLDAKPLRVKIIPPESLLLIRADTELANFKLSLYRIEGIERDGRPAAPEPEFVFNPLGIVSPFSLELAGATRDADRRLLWRIDRLGAVHVTPLL